jgi:hypothetical protein
MPSVLSLPLRQARDVVFALDIPATALFGVLAALVLLTIRGFVPLADGLPLVGVLALFVAPGVWYLRRVLPADQRGHAWWFGPVIGVSGSLLVLLVLWAAGNRTAGQLALASIGWWLLLGAASRLLPHPRLRLPKVGVADARALALLLMLVPVLVAGPFAKFGEDRPEGRAYRAYFTADVIWAMAVVAEVSKGSMPPQNPFIHDEPLRYYWLSHFLSAVEYRTMGDRLSSGQILLTNALGAGLIFVAFFYGFLRLALDRPWAAAVGASAPFLWNSFEGLDRLVVHWWQGASQRHLLEINIDSVTRWFYGGLPVDGLQRMLLYQPHHLLGYACGLLAAVIVARAEFPQRPLTALAAGACLGGAVLLSTFTAILLACTVALLYAWRLLERRAWLAIPICAIAGALPLLAAVWVAEYFQYVDRSGGSFVSVGLNRTAVTNTYWNLLLSFGPLLPLALVGTWLAARHRDGRFVPAVVLVVVGLAFYFVVDVREVPGWVAWRAGHIILMASAVLVGLVAQRVAVIASPAGRRMALGAMAILALTAAPTVAIDIYNAQDTDNPHQGPGFPWVLRLSNDELAALRWLQVHTRPWDLVQVDPIERGAGSWAYIPAFGERRMAGGVPISMVPVAKYEKLSHDIQRRIFLAPTAERAFIGASQYNIRYLYLGRQERHRHPQFEQMLRDAPHLFARVFVNHDVTIFRVGRGVRLPEAEAE